MGWSWMIILTYLWYWLKTEGGSDFLLGSRIEDYVDKKGDMRTLLQKARYAFNRLPKWLWPKGFNPKSHDNFMRLQNPQTGAAITGESNNPNWSTGGRYLSGLLDEFAKWEGSDESAWTAAADATPCRIALSTPFGAGGKYYEVVTDGKTKKLTTHWSLHPRKAEGLYCVWPKPEEAAEVVDSFHWVGLRAPWYDKECRRRKALEISQELDIDYIGSGNPVFRGKALRRISTLLRLQRSPVAYLEPLVYEQTLEEVSDYRDRDDLILVYEKPSEKHSYVVAADVAEGKVNGDYSVIKVLNRETESVAASYAAQIDEVELAGVFSLLTRWYSVGGRTPWWGVETNGPGLGCFNILTEQYELPGAFMMPKFDVAKQEVSFRKGWWTDTKSRKILISGIRAWLANGTGWANPRCLRELLSFININGKEQAKEGCYDDEVMCFGVALQLNAIVPRDFEEVVEIPKDYEEIAKDVLQRFKAVPVKTIEEQCLETALARQDEARLFDLTIMENELRQDSYNELLEGGY
uniref:Putative terminase n=1 Tax=viral metagenome TaxID=1070528 RepID=A0A6M3K8L1_9ZZZZ